MYYRKGSFQRSITSSICNWVEEMVNFLIEIVIGPLREPISEMLGSNRAINILRFCFIVPGLVRLIILLQCSGVADSMT